MGPGKLTQHIQFMEHRSVKQGNPLFPVTKFLSSQMAKFNIFYSCIEEKKVIKISRM